MRARLVYNIVTTLAEEVAIGLVGLWLLPYFGVAIPAWVVGVIMAAWLAWTVFTYRKGTTALRRPLADIIGQHGMAITRLEPRGQVKVQGEIWWAHADGDPIDAGVEIEVVSRQGLTLVVRDARSREGVAGPVHDGNDDEHETHPGQHQAENLQRPQGGGLDRR